ncbi:MAG: hypothetical protein JST30_16315 [Armatimonadetes bacterium]|nr:hypothetical protein [Armatimonadota bacterium]
MLATLTLSTVLFAGQSADKVNFAHRYAKGETLEYTFQVKGDADNGPMEINSAFTVKVGEKAEKGTDVTVVPKMLKMSMDGNEMDQGSSLGETKYTLDAFGLPDNVSMEGASGILMIPFVISYLPNKELASGETFDVKWDKEGAFVKGSGKYDGEGKVGEKTYPKLSMKTTFKPTGGNDPHEAQMTYDVYFDKESGHVSMVKGKVDVEAQHFDFTLTRK